MHVYLTKPVQCCQPSALPPRAEQPAAGRKSGVWVGMGGSNERIIDLGLNITPGLQLGGSWCIHGQAWALLESFQ